MSFLLNFPYSLCFGLFNLYLSTSNIAFIVNSAYSAIYIAVSDFNPIQ